MGDSGMVARHWSSFRLSCGERLLLRCDGNAWNSFQSTVGKDPSTREEARESRPHPEEPRFRLLARKENPFPAWWGKNSPRSRRISRGGALHRKSEMNSRIVPHSQCPPDVSVHSRETCFPCTAKTFKPRIDSHRDGTLDSPVGKPRGKAADPLIHVNGSETLLLQLGRKAHVHAPTRDED